MTKVSREVYLARAANMSGSRNKKTGVKNWAEFLGKKAVVF